MKNYFILVALFSMIFFSACSQKNPPENIKNEFSGFKTEEISTIENPEMKGFEVALKSKETEITVIIGTDGTVLKKESSDENKEEGINENEENEKEEK